MKLYPSQVPRPIPPKKKKKSIEKDELIFFLTKNDGYLAFLLLYLSARWLGSPQQKWSLENTCFYL